MAKTKTPFLSFGAQGTIGDALTAQKTGAETLLRQKPIPTYRNTLPQQYQRWLYEDYVYLWTQQSAATKQEYATAGVRYHLTGFQYWMRYHLRLLPDILGYWKLDEKAGAIAHDSSTTGNNGIITGASPYPSRINGGYYFDGLNDEINFGNNTSLDLGTQDFTIELFVKPFAFPAYAYLFGRIQGGGDYWRIFISPTYIAIDIRSAALRDELICGGLSLVNGTWYHLLFTGDRDGNLSGYLDGAFLKSIAMSNWGYIGFNAQLNLGKAHITTFYEFAADHLVIYRRLLFPTTIKRHAERRYSL